MANSGVRTSSAPAATSRSYALAIFSKLPRRSPTVGLSWAKPIFMLDYAEYAQRGTQQSSFVRSRLTRHRMVLVSFVQSVISFFDKLPAKLIETCGYETREHTDHHLL